uniref:Uncharacterized protein n=1 Tax=Rhizophora mucronata TaxID=61149 RepID=A0A2P2QJF4_RHIMU
MQWGQCIHRNFHHIFNQISAPKAFYLAHNFHAIQGLKVSDL